ncbi:MAG: hypothetical protein QG552_1930 [Thermodesulfobacteriota bacterium]|nr:hypothetical protein [Thermodesulfobacteriota bacterium]
MAGKWILVPYNFTDYDERALHYVIRTFADQKAVHVTLLHVYIPLPELDSYSHAGLGRLKTTMASMWTEVREKEQELKRVREDLIDNGFQEDQVSCMFIPRVKNIGSELVEAARKGPYNIVVISQKPRKATRAFTRRIHDILITELRNMEIVIIT